MIDSFSSRACGYGEGFAYGGLGFGLSMAIVALLLITDIRQFRRMEKRFADVI